MRDFEAAKELFADKLNPHLYFDSMSAEIARNKILESIHNKVSPLIFIIGDPGVGKSYILRYIHNHINMNQVSILIDHPFFDKRDLLKMLYDAIDLTFDKDINFNELKDTIVTAYKDKNHTIFIDEAQLLNEEQFELIRILSDTKAFQFVLSMHKEEGEAILEKKHFKSRTKVVINYGNLSKDEINRYIQSTFFEHSHGDIANLFLPKHIKKIATLTKGNFRTVKKYIFTLLRLLDYAKKNGLQKHQQINETLLIMSALDIGLLHDKR
ncbi:MAG: ATP-binding protein [Sulfurospirillum sp.]|nr:ATP-binding protein [Sulfurospirillum sp.]